MAYDTKTLRELIRDAQESARLSAWEQEFMHGMATGLQRYGDDFELSPRQTEILERIETKLYQVG